MADRINNSVNNKHYFMFFDNAKMPVAVFLTSTEEEAKSLFKILYRESWEQSLAKGIFCVKESDVLPTEWDRIHDEYEREKSKKLAASLVLPKSIQHDKDNWFTYVPHQTAPVVLETLKYMKHWHNPIREKCEG